MRTWPRTRPPVERPRRSHPRSGPSKPSNVRCVRWPRECCRSECRREDGCCDPTHGHARYHDEERCQALTAITPSPALGAARRRPARDDPVRRTGPHQAPIRRRRPRKLCSSGVRRCATARVSFSWRCRPPARPGLSLRGRASAPKVRGGTGKTGRTYEAVERRAANSRAGPSHLPLQRRDLDPPAVDGSSGRLL